MTRLALLVTSSAVISGAVISSDVVARADVIEQVVATVNDEALFLSDLRRRATPFFPQVFSASTPEERRTRLSQLYSELRERLIDEELFEQSARRMQVRVSSRDVQRAVENVMRENGLSEDQFWEAVRGQGYTETGYRADVRRQLLRLKVLNQRVRSRVNITEEDVRRRYDQRLRQANRTLRFRISHVFLELAEDASATDLAETLGRAEALRARLSTETFADVAAEVGGGELGWVSEGDLSEALARPLQTMEAGQISDPVRGSGGVHIFLMHERERGSSELPPFDDVKNQLYQQMIASAMERQEQIFLEELRGGAIISRREL